MTPVEAVALLFTTLTAAVVVFALKGWGRDIENGSEWPYAVLGVFPGASLDVVRKAYRELVKKYHPDRLPPNSSPELRKIFEEQMIRLNTAYRTILAFYDNAVQSLKLTEEHLTPVEKILKQSETAIRDGLTPGEIVKLCFQAAETLVFTLYRAAGLVIVGKHFYDILTELMINDLITLDEFNTLVEIKKLHNRAYKTIPTIKDALTAVRRLNWVYLKIRDRYVVKRDV